MKKILIKIMAVSLILSSISAAAQPGPAPRPSPQPNFTPATRPSPAPRRAPPRAGGEWHAVGGIAYLTGTVIRACTEAPVVVVAPPAQKVVVVNSSPTVVVQQPSTTVVVQAPAALSKEALRAELAGMLSSALQNIPYSVSVDNFYAVGSSYGASVSVIVAVGGSNYSITSGGVQPSYSALKTYLGNEISSAVAKLAEDTPQSTTVVQIQ